MRQRITLTKIQELDDAVVRHNIEEGHQVQGELMAEPRVGEPFYVGWGWRTSTVVEVLPENVFRTLNSIYKVTYWPDPLTA